MSAAQPKAPKQPELLELPVDKVKPNKRNPRLIFPQDELDRLAASIDLEGVLVPIVVYPRGDGYVLIDGERRFRCAKTLGLDTVPAQIVDEKSAHDVLVQMFNIHQIREPWQDMPTAKALGQLVEQLEKDGQDTSDKALRDLTGLSVDRVRQLRYVLTLPEQWQKYIEDSDIPLNFFWELKRLVDALAKQRPKLSEELGGEHKISQALVDKRINGAITDTVSLRLLRPIINFAEKDAGGAGAPSVLDANLRDLVTVPDLTIDDVYEDTVQIMVETDKLERRTRSMYQSFERLLEKASPEERDRIKEIGKAFAKNLAALVK